MIEKNIGEICQLLLLLNLFTVYMATVVVCVMLVLMSLLCPRGNEVLQVQQQLGHEESQESLENAENQSVLQQ